MKERKMSDKKNTPETTIATLDMEGSGTLTITNKHLRGQVLRFVQEGNMKIKQQEQIDVLLSAVGGYSVIDVPMKIARIVAVVTCAVIGIICWGLYALLGKLFDMSAAMPILATLVAVGAGILSWLMIRDQVVLQLNIMGGKFNVPLKPHEAPKVREFITKLQQAKTEYEEANG